MQILSFYHARSCDAARPSRPRSRGQRYCAGRTARAGAARKGIAIPEEQLSEQEAAIIAHFDAQEDAFYTSGRVLDHGVIDPRDTRKVLAFCLETVLEGRGRTLTPNSFGVARM